MYAEIQMFRDGIETANNGLSEQNIEVSSVQFVIKTEVVEITEPEKSAEKLNFGQKLLRLFGLY